MLILTRKIGQSVVIGDELYCTVLGFRDRYVSLGFDAPKSLKIHREEIQQLIINERHSNQKDVTNEKINETLIQLLMDKFKQQGNSAATH